MSHNPTSQTPEPYQAANSNHGHEPYEDGLDNSAASVPALILGQVFSEQGKPGLKIQLFVDPKQNQKAGEQEPETRLPRLSLPRAGPASLPAEKRPNAVCRHRDPPGHSGVSNSRPPMIVLCKGQPGAVAHAILLSRLWCCLQ